MDFGNACLFNKKPADMLRIGALGGRARAESATRKGPPGTRYPRTQPIASGNRGRGHPTHRCPVPLAGWCGVLRGTAAEQMQACAWMYRVKQTTPCVLRK